MLQVAQQEADHAVVQGDQLEEPDQPRVERDQGRHENPVVQGIRVAGG
jgi:hypothetical protein